ncbi:MAG: FAD-dependent oxidoreductase [Planctomycetes bacterium]|nr:FAD-dependent oxidoreductase [Planctomycetota bacterium]
MKRRTFLGAAALAVTTGALADEKKSVGRAVVTPASDTIEEKPRNVPVVQQCDVCVLGGSCTGVFAAVRAAQMGAKVALVEKQNAFGGVATAGLVNIWHKLISNKGKEQIIGGLTQRTIENLQRIGAVAKRGHGYGLNTEELKIELDKLVLEHAITPYLHTFYASPRMEGDRATAVFIENKSGRQAIRAKVFVDATGDGDLAKDAGLPFEIRNGLQPPTTCAKISGLPRSADGMLKLIAQHRDEFGLAPDHGWGASVPGSSGVEMCAYRHVFDTTASDANQLTAAEIDGRRQIRAYMDIARKYGGDDNTPCLLDLASTIGIRETRAFTANYKLTEDDVLQCRRFPDAIANGTYHIDVHDPTTGRFKFKEPRGDFYQIPLSTMVSDKTPNIVLAGRMISTDRSAFGGIRVMVNLNQTGEAAGVAAALAASRAEAVSEVAAESVREHLAKLGAVVV